MEEMFMNFQKKLLGIMVAAFLLITAGVTYSWTDIKNAANWVDGLTAGTVTASKAAVVDANKDIGDFRNLDAVNIDAGASGTAGSLDVFPTTAANGKFSITATDQGSDITSILNLAAQTQANTISLPDVNLAASYVGLSTAALAATEMDVLDGAVAGTPTASKAFVADANANIGALKATSVSVGATGSEIEQPYVVSCAVSATQATQDGDDGTGVSIGQCEIDDNAIVLSAQLDITTGYNEAGDTLEVHITPDGAIGSSVSELIADVDCSAATIQVEVIADGATTERVTTTNKYVDVFFKDVGNDGSSGADVVGVLYVEVMPQ